MDLSNLPPDVQAAINKAVADALAAQAAANAPVAPPVPSPEDELDNAVAAVARAQNAERSHPHEVSAILAAVQDALERIVSYIKPRPGTEDASPDAGSTGSADAVGSSE